MSNDYLSAVEVSTARDADASVIWLHGLGADGHDFEPIVPQLRLGPLAVRFVFPHAPARAVTLNGGLLMPAWYDIVSLTSAAHEDARGIRGMAPAVEALIGRERERGIAASRIVLAGFSQGGAMALHVGLRHPEPLAGIMGLSAYLPLRAQLGRERNPANGDTPIFLAHGTQDPVLDVAFGTSCRDLLRNLGYTLEWHEYPMAHAVCPQEIEDIRRWLIGRLSDGRA
ncbi:MAG: alpha/beta hydrolase [Gammaproteobacteria bacterium]